MQRLRAQGRYHVRRREAPWSEKGINHSCTKTAGTNICYVAEALSKNHNSFNQEQTIQSFQLLNYQNMNQIFDNIAD